MPVARSPAPRPPGVPLRGLIPPFPDSLRSHAPRGSPFPRGYALTSRSAVQGCRAAGLHGCTAARLHGSTAARQHRCTAAPQHRSTAAPQHRSTAARLQGCRKGRAGDLSVEVSTLSYDELAGPSLLASAVSGSGRRPFAPASVTPRSATAGSRRRRSRRCHPKR